MPNARHMFRPASYAPRRLAAVFLLLIAAPGLTGCVGAAVGAGATIGLAAFQERGVEGVARDSGQEKCS